MKKLFFAIVLAVFALPCFGDVAVVSPEKEYDTEPVFTMDVVDEMNEFIARQPDRQDERMQSTGDGMFGFRFTVDRNGDVRNVHIFAYPDRLIAKEIAAIIENGKWTPAMKDGKPVAVDVNLMFNKFRSEVSFCGEHWSNFNNYASMRVRYPSDVYSQGIEGRVVASFIVKKDGSLDSVQIETSPYDSLSAEVLRVIKSSNGLWSPGMILGIPVNVRMAIPVNFRLYK